jgi:hypothetical protein
VLVSYSDTGLLHWQYYRRSLNGILLLDGVMPMDRRERIIELSTTILRLRDQLRVYEAELDTLIGAPAPTVQQSVPEHHVAQPETEETMADRIIRILEQSREKDFDGREMLQRLQLPELHLASIRSTLHRLYGEHRIARSAPGRFSALQRNQAGMSQPEGETPSHHGVRNAAA